jgi:hypothetical protein
VSRWKSVIRGMIKMGLTFAAAGGALFGTLAVVLALFFPGGEDELGFMVLAATTWGFGIGVSFAGVLAIAARGRSADTLSLPRVAAVGLGGGFLLAALLVAATLPEWTAADALVPFVVLPLLGCGAATGSLLLARRARPELPPGEASNGLGQGAPSGHRPPHSR